MTFHRPHLTKLCGWTMAKIINKKYIDLRVQNCNQMPDILEAKLCLLIPWAKVLQQEPIGIVRLRWTRELWEIARSALEVTFIAENISYFQYEHSNQKLVPKFYSLNNDLYFHIFMILTLNPIFCMLSSCWQDTCQCLMIISLMKYFGTISNFSWAGFCKFIILFFRPISPAIREPWGAN